MLISNLKNPALSSFIEKYFSTLVKPSAVASLLLFSAPAVTVGETEGSVDFASVFFASSFAYNFVRK